MKIIGHRGAAGLAPENTLTSIEKALSCHVNEIEIDVRIDSRGNVVLRHDDDISTMHNLPTLSDAIKLINRRVPLIIEIKPRQPIKPIVKILKYFLAKEWTPRDFSLASFDPKVLAGLSHELPNIPLVVNEKWSGIRATWRARRLGTKRLAMNQRWLWPGFIKSIALAGYELSAYPLNNPSKAARWQKYGLSAVITDYPDRFEKPKS